MRHVFGSTDPLRETVQPIKGLSVSSFAGVRTSSVGVAPIREGRWSMSSTIPFARAHRRSLYRKGGENRGEEADNIEERTENLDTKSTTHQRDVQIL